MAQRQSSRQTRRRLSRRPSGPRPTQAAQELAAVKAELALFTSGAAHELQQPLRKIIAAACRLRAGPQPPGAVERDARRIEELAMAMRSLVDYLVAYQQASATTLTIQTLEPREAVADVLAGLKPIIAREKGRVIVGELPAVRADPIQLRQLLRHLVENGLKFHRFERPPVVRIGGRRRAGFVELRVEDDGIGIDPRYFDKVFEPFARLNCPEAYPGSGLGLPICRKIAVRHGGSIDVRCPPGHGACFTVRLPAA